MTNDVFWIWKNKGFCMETVMIEFRKKIEISEIPQKCKINICADSRYILYINDYYVSAGPCRGSAHDRYFDTVDVTPYLKKGENLLFAKVIHYTKDPISNNLIKGGPVSVESTLIGGFLIEDLSGVGLQTNDSWQCREAKEHAFDSSFKAFSYIDTYEICDYRFRENDWRQAVNQYDNKPYLHGGLVNVWRTKPRPIPQMEREKANFYTVTTCSGMKKENIEALLLNKSQLIIPAETKVTIEIDPYVYQTGHIVIDVDGGKDSEIVISYSEKNRKDARKSFYETGHYIDEVSDKYILCGESNIIEPFYYRAFRFLRFDITTKNEPLKINDIHLIKTSYPLEVSGSFYSSDEMLNKIWEVSLRTLRCCMYETYMDCPFYEQMQYVMDTMLQVIYTYQVSNDDRLARKAIDDFSRAQLFDGMLTCNAPSTIRQIIPGFSIYWIIMLSDHYKYFADEMFLRQYLPELEKLLLYFENHTDDDTGLIVNTGYWQFVDWVKEWNLGRPTLNEDNYIYSMMVIYSYTLAAEIFNVVGQYDRSKQILRLAEKMRKNVYLQAYDKSTKLYRDAPDMEPHSMHAQIWAVLAEIEDASKLRELMNRALDSDLYSVSYCMLFFQLRAAEKTNLYNRTENMWGDWVEHIKTGSTTWPEDPVSNRSECHAWGSVALYDYAACYLGVSPLEAGYNKVLIEPKALWLNGCEGVVATCKGDIKVKWEKKENKVTLKAVFSQPMDVVVRLLGVEKLFFGVTECDIEE